MNQVSGKNDTEAVAQLLEQYLARVDAGETVGIDSFLAPYAAVAPRVRDCLESLRLVGSASSALQLPDPALNLSDRETTKLGDFKLIREIGRGGMGVIYEAEQEKLARRVALKVLPYAALLDERRLTRFKNEARAAAILEHPNIVDVYFVGEDRGIHFYAMELIDGCSLVDFVPSGHDERTSGEGQCDREVRSSFDESTVLARLSTEQTSGSHAFLRTVTKLGIQAADALQYAHERRVIHRDIKPSNLLLNSEGELRIADFGLARFLDSAEELTVAGDVVGTFRYMSPEQAAGEFVDNRTDIYSLGTTLYELFTAKPAIQGSIRGEILEQVLAGVSPRHLPELKHLPRDLQTILLKSMARCPQDRYASAAEMRDDLQRFLDHRPIASRRTSPVRQLIGWSRRNPQLAGVSSLLAALLVAVSVFSSVTAFRASADADRQRETTYARDMLFAQNAAENGMTDEADEVLGRWEKSPSTRELRGWEWYWLRNEVTRLSAEQTIRPGPAGADCIRFSADGRELYAGHFGNRFSQFDVSSGQRRWVTRLSGSSIDALCLLDNGKKLAALENDGTVSVWDASSKQEVSSWATGIDYARSFCISHDSQYALIASTADEDGKSVAKVFDTNNGMELAAHDSDRDVVGAFTRELLVLASGQGIHGYSLGSWNRVVEQRSVAGKPCCIISAGDRIAVAYAEKAHDKSRVEIWQASSMKQMSSYLVPAEVRALAYSPTNDLLATGDASGTVFLLDLHREFPTSQRQLHAAAIDDIDFSPDGRQLVTASKDSTIRVWNIAAIREHGRLPTIGKSPSTYIQGVGFCDQGKRVCSAESTGLVRVVDVHSEKMINEFQVSCAVSDKSRMLTSPSGRYLAVVRYRFPSRQQPTRAVIYDTESQQVVSDFTLPRGTYRPSIAFSRNEKWLALGAWDEVIIRGTRENRLIARVKLPKDSDAPIVKAVAFSADDKYVYCGTEDGATTKVATSGILKWRAQVSDARTLAGSIMSFSISPDGKLLAVVGFDERVTLWRLPSLRAASTKFEVSRAPLLHVTFSPDGKRLLTTSKSGFAEIWSVSSGRRLAAIKASSGWLDAGCFSSDGRSLLLGGDGKMKLLRASGSREREESPNFH